MQNNPTENFVWQETPLKQNMLIEASAGTGKTYSLIHIILRLLFEEDIEIHRILVVTFTVAAAAELKARIRQKLLSLTEAMKKGSFDGLSGDLQEKCKEWQEKGLWKKSVLDKALEDFDQCQVSTIHGFCQKMLTENEFTASQGYGYEIGSDDEISTRLCEDFLREQLARTTDPGEIAALMRFGVSSWKSLLTKLQMLPSDSCIEYCDENNPKFPAGLVDIMKTFVREMPAKLKDAKRRAKLRSYNDLLVDMQNELGNENFVKNVRSRYKAVLIDEFQDTDPVQYEIFRTLFLPEAKTDAAGYPQTVIFVGDPKQSIYRFRDADLNTYLKAKNELGNTKRLDSNFRSTPLLLAAFNAYFANSTGPESNSAFLTPDIVHEDIKACSTTLPLMRKIGDRFEPLPVFEIWHSPLQATMNTANLEEFEADCVLADIQRLLAGDVYLDAQKSQKVNPSHIAVLVGKYKYAGTLLRKLVRSGIRVSVEKGRDVFLQPQAGEILRLLQAMEVPEDVRRMRLARMTTVIGEPLETIVGESVVSHGRTTPEADPAADKARRVFTAALSLAQSRRLATGFALIFKEYGTRERLLLEKNGERAVTNLYHIVELLQQKASTLKNLSGLITWFKRECGHESDDDSRMLRAESDTEAITVLSIHKSKGLEFPIVYVVGAFHGIKAESDKIFRTMQQGKTHLALSYGDIKSQTYKNGLVYQEQQQEMVRQAYVAMTRASQRLVLPLMMPKTNVTNSAWRSPNMANPYFWLLMKSTKKYKPEIVLDQIKGFESLYLPKVAHLGSAPLEAIRVLCGSTITAAQCLNISEPSFMPDQQPLLHRRVRHRGDLTLGASRPVFADWSRSSFTAITRKVTSVAEGSVMDQLDEELISNSTEPAGSRTPVEPEGMMKLAGGAEFGVCMHELFEKADFALAGKAAAGDQKARLALKAFVAKTIVAYRRALFNDGSMDEACEIFTEMLCSVLTASLGKVQGSLLRLCDIKASDRLTELPFMIRIARAQPDRAPVTAANLSKLLSYFDERYALPDMTDEDLKGYLVGFIDLAFRDPLGRYWIVDWKSNRAGVQKVSDYTEDYVRSQMAEHHYTLQYLLYLVALRRYLRMRSEAVEIAAAAYVFVRGVDPAKTGQGIWIDSVEPALLDCLDDFFNHGFDESAVQAYAARCCQP